MAEDKRKKNKTKSQTIYISKKTNKYKERIPSSKLSKIVLKLFFLILFFNSISSSEEKAFKLRKLEILSRITMIIEGIGTKYILGDKFNILPSEVSVNNINQSIINKTYLLEENENIIT